MEKIKQISILSEEHQCYLNYILNYVERYNKQDEDRQVAHCAQKLSDLIDKQKFCEYDHNCTRGCGNDHDCPCDAEHWCSMSSEHDAEDCKDSDDGCPQHPRELSNAIGYDETLLANE